MGEPQLPPHVCSWSDEDGKPLGEWHPITCAEADAIRAANPDLTPAAGRTDSETPDVYTSWARRGDNWPLVCYWRGPGECRHGVYVLSKDAANVEKAISLAVGTCGPRPCAYGTCGGSMCGGCCGCLGGCQVEYETADAEAARKESGS